MTSSHSDPDRPLRVIYVSYDGMGEPLGRSQVLAYLFRMAGSCQITLVSFEKPDADLEALRAELAAGGIAWRPLRYHKRPPVLSTILDVVAGVREVLRGCRVGKPDVVHARSYVPALIALLARPFSGGNFVFDIRGFWPEERVEGGIWPADGLLFRVAKRCERWFFASADAVVTLTDVSVPRIRELMDGRDAPLVVIPTCVDLNRFADSKPRSGAPHVLWCGSIGTWYRFDLAPPLARALGMELEVVTRQTALAHQHLDGLAATVRTLPPAEVPTVMRQGDVGLSLCRNALAMQAMAPTRFGEYLAAGMPVIVTPGLGDVERLVTERRVGTVLVSEDEAGFAAAADAIRMLLAEPELPTRCRELARELFDVEAGAAAYLSLYAGLRRPPSGAPSGEG
jgi:glycosyltransferase involved in cell wall biosynthesis